MISMMYVFRDKIIDGINTNLWPLLGTLDVRLLSMLFKNFPCEYFKMD